MQPLPHFRRWLLGLLALSLAVRLFGLNWDDGHNFHPDERRIAEAVVQLSFEPLQLNPHFFAYGSVPIYATKVVTSLLAQVKPWFASYDAAVRCGRAVSAVWGTATILLLVLLGRRLYGERVGLLAGGMLGATVLHLQNSHFFASDVPLTCLVTLVLLLLVRAVQLGRTRDLAGAGLVVGLALATKVSAAPLLLPLGLAVLIRARTERSIGRPALGALAAAGLVVVGFFLGEPYAFLDFARFAADVREQSQMVRHAGLLPYTNQYLGVPKVLYDLKEMVLWGMGPLLGVAALVGTWQCLRAAGRRGEKAEWLLLAWVVPFFAISASFDVKFMRYLLPIYPPLVLLASVALEGWAERSARGILARRLVVAGTVVWALAFLSVYTRPHTVVTASEWFYDHVPAGTRVLTQDWDEGFPFPLPGRDPGRYPSEQLAYYEPDSAAKAATLGRELASAEYLVLQTKRLYGAITQAASKFPLTDRYFRLLFAGDLGYTLVAEFSSRPGLLGLGVPTELADESFSVYDHPRVLVFRNTSHRTAEELTRLVNAGIPSRVLSRADLLRARPQPAAKAVAAESSSWLRSSPVAILLVAGLLELLGLVAYVHLAAVGLPRQGLFALSRVAGCLLFAFPLWLAASLGVAPFTRPTILVWIAILAASAWRLRGRAGVQAGPERREVVASQVVFWGAYSLFLLMRALNPEVYWGEKPMDFAFLNTLYRATTMPPPEPWFAGSQLNYTYFGHFLMAAIGKATGVDPALMFNLGIAASAALTAAALLAAGTVLARNWRAGTFAVALTLVVGNLSGVREIAARRVVDFDYFWATSRVVPNTINEFPFWSFVFADLHAHVMAMPFAVAFVALVLMWRRSARGAGARPRLVMLALGSLFLAAVVATSAWSAPTFVALLLGVLGLDWVHRSQGGFLRRMVSGVRTLVLPAAFVIGGAFVLLLPFWRSYTPPPRNLGWEVGPYAKPFDYLTIFGGFLVLLVPYLFVIWRRVLAGKDRRLSRGQKLRVSGLVVLLAATLVDWTGAAHGSFHQAESVASLGFGLTLLALAVALHRRLPARHRIPVALTAFALLVTASCELVFVWDRMNTLFKFYLDSWLVFGVAASFVAWQLCRGLLARGWARGFWRALAAGAVVVGLFTSVSGAYGALTHRHVGGPRWTLDGTAYLGRHAPGERAAYAWLNRNVAGTPVLCEAYGPAYQEFARVTMNTGLPTVLGWDYHVFQRGQKWPQINARKEAVKTVYTSADQDAVELALARYRVALVFVGPLERHTYGGSTADRFEGWSDLLTPVYRNGEVTIFAVNQQLGTLPPSEATVEVPEQPPDGHTEQDAPGHFRQPRGLACDSSGNVYVADFGNDRVQKLDPKLVPLLTWGKRGALEGELQEPCGVAVGPDDTVYVADTWNARIQVFASGGAFLRELRADLYGARSVAVDSAGRVFVSDTGNARVVRFSPEGEKDLEWGGRGSAPGKLEDPMGLAVNSQGEVLVCDNGNARVQVFDREGRFLRSFRVPGWRREVFSEPFIAVAGDGTIWVTVPLEGEVRRYTATGTLVQKIGGSSFTDAPFVRPVGVTLDRASSRLVVTDVEDGVVGFSVVPTAGVTPGSPSTEAPR